MKKKFAILLFAVSLMSLKSIAQNPNEKIGIIESISLDGKGILRDTQTDELKSFDLKFNPGASVIIGMEVIFIDLPSGASEAISDVKEGKKGLNAVNVKLA